MTDLKISQFANGSTIQVTDEIATNRGGTNTKVFVGSAATADIGTDAGDIPTNSFLGSAAYQDTGTDVGNVVILEAIGISATPGLPAVDGSQLTGFVGDGTILVESDDALPGYLANKIIEGREIVTTVLSDSDGEKTLEIDVRQNQATNASVGSGTHTANIANGIWQKVTATGNFTLDATFDPGKVQSMIIEAVNWGAYTVTLSAFLLPGGSAPSFTSSGSDLICLSQDASNNKYLSVVGLDMS